MTLLPAENSKHGPDASGHSRSRSAHSIRSAQSIRRTHAGTSQVSKDHEVSDFTQFYLPLAEPGRCLGRSVWSVSLVILGGCFLKRQLLERDLCCFNLLQRSQDRFLCLSHTRSIIGLLVWVKPFVCLETNPNSEGIRLQQQDEDTDIRLKMDKMPGGSA